jgi:CRISPR-associated protein Csb2
MGLTIEVRFLLGGFAASDGHDETPPEWPPSPARLFSALLAACEGDHADALRWLEEQPLPVIHAADPGRAELHPQWLVENRWEAGGSSARHPARNPRARSRFRLHPCVPLLVYHWPDAEASEAVVAALDDAAGRLHYLGRPINPVAVRVHGDGPPNTDTLVRWVRGEDGFETSRLRIPYPGYFDALTSAFAAGVRVDPPVYEYYRRQTEETAPRESEPEGFSPWAHLLVLPLITRAWIPGERALEVTEALRSAVLDLIGQDISPVICGHGVTPPHCAYVAFPFVGHEHADGHILGIGLALPADADAVRQIRRALDPDESGRYGITLRNVRGFGQLRFERPLDRTTEVPWGARRERWTGPARRWRTVLPAVLDRAPSRRIAEEEAMLETVANVGLGEALVRVEARRAPFARGDLALRPDRTRRRPDDRVRPYRHLRLEFDRPVRGPLLLGAMRHFGLGLCVPDEP